MSHRVDYTQNQGRTTSLEAYLNGAKTWRILPAARTDSVIIYLGDVIGDAGIWPLSAVGSTASFFLYPASSASPPGNWDFVTSVPVDGLGTDGRYSVIVPTLADSTLSDGMHWTTYFVRGRTATPGVAYESAPDSGYSVDNLAPSVPAGLLASAAGGGFDLSWDANPEPDVRYYNVYRGSSEGFVADDLSRIGSTAGSSFSDAASGGETYYKVAAVDFSGNEGIPAETHGMAATTPGARLPPGSTS